MVKITREELLDRLLGVPWPAYAFLVPVFVLASFARPNAGMVTLHAMMPSLLAWWGVVAVLLCLVAIPTRSLGRASLVVGSVVFGSLLDGYFADRSVGPISLTAVFWVGWFGFVAVSATLPVSQVLVATRYGNLTLTIAVLVVTVDWFHAARGVKATLEARTPIVPGTLLSAIMPSHLPDIYYIVLDGYARADVLRDLYRFETDLPSRLGQRGFEVADAAASNYGQTALSLAAALNLDYLPPSLGRGSHAEKDRLVLRELIGSSLMVRTLRSSGYRVVTYDGEYSLVELKEPDERRRPWPQWSEWELFLYTMSAAPRVGRIAGRGPGWVAHEIRRRQVQWVFDDLSNGAVARDGQPTFVFVHSLVPHPPFVFEDDGAPRRTNMPAGIEDGDHWQELAAAAGEDYRDGYLAAVKYVNGELLRTIDAVLNEAERPTLILVHGDHGPGSQLDWESRARSNVKERLAILLAARLGDSARGLLYPTATPVNAARILLSAALGTDLPRVADRSYYSTWSRPFAFEDVTAEVLPADLARARIR